MGMFNQQLYDAMVEDTMILTARPELQAETEMYVRQATATAHMLAFFPRDLVVTQVQLPNPVSMVQLNIPSLFPRMRALESVRCIDTQGNAMDYPAFSVIEVGDVYVEGYNSLRNNVAYIGGASLNIRGAITGAALVSYYTMPNVRRDSYDSWIAQLFPEVITQRAAQLLFNDTGDDAKSQQKQRMLNDGRGGGLENDLIRNFLIAQAR